MGNCRCCFCLETKGRDCVAVVTHKKGVPSLSSKCVLRPKSMNYGSALKGSPTSPCTNINIPCPEEGCDAFPTTYGLIPHYATARPGLPVNAVLGDVENLVFQPKEQLSGEEEARVKDLLGTLHRGC